MPCIIVAMLLCAVVLAPPSMAAKDTCFRVDQKQGQRTYAVGFGGDGQWMADINGDGRADFVYNRDGTREQWVMLACNAVSDRTGGSLSNLRFLDAWGERYIHDNGFISGFQDAYKLNKNTRRVSNGPNTGKTVPHLVAVSEYRNPTFSLSPYHLYGPDNTTPTLALGKGANVGGAGRSPSAANSFPGGTEYHDNEL